MGKPFRVLALDGGGIKGVFSAAALAQLEDDTGHRALDHFDLIAGTSTGSILAIGLGLGMTAAELRDLYIDNAKKIFPTRMFLGPVRSTVRHLFGPKHSADALRAVLAGKLGKKRLGHSKVRLIIPTFDALKGTACTFKTAHHQNLKHEYKMLAVDVAMASAAAPTYYPAATVGTRRGAAYFDGGVWGNCPALAGIVEAVSYCGQDLSDIHVLSIGTTEEVMAFGKKKNAGIVTWNKGVADIFMAGQVSSSLAQARLLVRDRLLRINHQTAKGLYSLDHAPSVNELAELGASVAREAQLQARVASTFLNGKHVTHYTPSYPA